VAGDTPIAAALLRLGPELGLDAVPGRGDDSGSPVPSAEHLALVVAAHGRDERAILRAALEADVPYVGLVASRRRGGAVLRSLRDDGVPEELIGRIDTPAGLDIGARTPSEIALSILASIIEVRRRSSTTPRSWAAAPPAMAVDPICGMSVLIEPSAPSTQRDGETYYFCGEHCRQAFEHQA
jgi:xanthine/CO dehydrogenase XdhC/CoxF family maturation factor